MSWGYENSDVVAEEANDFLFLIRLLFSMKRSRRLLHFLPPAVAFACTRGPLFFGKVATELF